MPSYLLQFKIGFETFAVTSSNNITKGKIKEATPIDSLIRYYFIICFEIIHNLVDFRVPVTRFEADCKPILIITQYKVYDN